MSYKLALLIDRLNEDTISFKLPTEPAFKKKLIALIGNEKSVYCEFSRIRRRRSTGYKSQNHHLNGHIVQIMTSCGMNSEKEYEQVKTEIKRIAHFSFGYPSDKTGHFFKSESDCNTAECAMLIEASHMLAAELGIILTESEE